MRAVAEGDSLERRVGALSRVVVCIGIAVLLVMAVIELQVLPRRSFASMTAGALLFVGGAVELILTVALMGAAQRRQDLRGPGFWGAIGLGVLTSLPFGRMVVSLSI